MTASILDLSLRITSRLRFNSSYSVSAFSIMPITFLLIFLVRRSCSTLSSLWRLAHWLISFAWKSKSLPACPKKVFSFSIQGCCFSIAVTCLALSLDSFSHSFSLWVTLRASNDFAWASLRCLSCSLCSALISAEHLLSSRFLAAVAFLAVSNSALICCNFKLSSSSSAVRRVTALSLIWRCSLIVINSALQAFSSACTASRLFLKVTSSARRALETFWLSLTPFSISFMTASRRFLLLVSADFSLVSSSFARACCSFAVLISSPIETSSASTAATCAMD
mmetsp:Transcript_48949/g.85531  ORF Transcript_48949/g.85531 Transcript_48949/m.85531 type:complete len:280 (+) Transcript_48949:686-1525(+)